RPHVPEHRSPPARPERGFSGQRPGRSVVFAPMAAISGRANIRQVATLAVVSHQTVSRVLNGHASIRPATRARVLEAIEELDYRPYHAARALATRKTNRFGVIV